MTIEEYRKNLCRELERRGLDHDTAQLRAERTYLAEDGTLAHNVTTRVPDGADPVAHAADLIVSTRELTGGGEGEEGEGEPKNRYDRIRMEMAERYRTEEDRQDRFRELAERQGMTG